MEQLRELRTAKGVSQQVVADYLEITRQAYSNYENGNRDPDNETLLKLAEYFGVTVDYLLRGKENAPTQEGERQVSDQEIRAAFFGGADDLSEEEMSAMWDDAKDYIQYKLEQRRRKKNGGFD